MEDNTGSRESKKKSMEDNTRSSESKEKRRKSMEDNTRSSETKEKKRKSMEDNTPTENPSYFFTGSCEFYFMASQPLRWAGSSSPHSRRSIPDTYRSILPIPIHRDRYRYVTRYRDLEPGQNIVLVRPKPLGNPTAPMEADEEIIEEKAVCKVCFAILREEENILKTKCKCGNALIHETCVADGNNCDYCEQEVQNFPVTLVRGLSSSTPAIKKKAKNVFGCFHG